MSSSKLGRSCAGALATGLGIVLIGVGGTSTAMADGCPDLGAIKNIRVKNVSCKKANKVIGGWATGTDFLGFTCSDGSSKITCRKGDAVIRFTA